MVQGFVHTVHAGDGWTNSIEGNEAHTHALFQTEELAVEAGRGEARRRGTEDVIHNEDGTIAERNSYGNDPPTRPG